MFWYFLLLALILLIIFCIISYKIYKKIDCDLTLLFFSWFGRSRSEFTLPQNCLRPFETSRFTFLTVFQPGVNPSQQNHSLAKLFGSRGHQVESVNRPNAYRPSPLGPNFRTVRLSNAFLSHTGEYTAYEIAKLGGKLILSGTSLERLEAVRSRCLSCMDKRNEDNILIVPFDITKFDLHEGALNKALGHFEKVIRCNQTRSGFTTFC